MDRLSPEEARKVLRLLLDQHTEMRADAERIATKLISSPSRENVAAAVLDAVTSVDLDALNGRAGKHAWGYVEPGEAAGQLLHESLETLIDEMKRSADLGMLPAATSICAGIVEGLYQAREEKSDNALNWAPEFPEEEAEYIVTELLRDHTRPTKRAMANQVGEILTNRTPEWTDMLQKALAKGVKG